MAFVVAPHRTVSHRMTSVYSDRALREGRARGFDLRRGDGHEGQGSLPRDRVPPGHLHGPESLQGTPQGILLAGRCW